MAKAPEQAEHHQKFEGSHSSDSTSHSLMPSFKDMQSFRDSVGKTPPGRCDLPDYTIENDGNGDYHHEPTQKRMDYNDDAYKALNSPDKESDKPASTKEKETAGQVAELLKKAARDLATSTQNLDRNDDNEKLRDIFKNLPPDSAQRVVTETNKLLAGSNLRVAQSESGEIWSGSHKSSSEPFYLDTMLKPVECTPVA